MLANERRITISVRAAFYYILGFTHLLWLNSAKGNGCHLPFFAAAQS
jgi:hypothetical protein